jgi:triacylglycerol lipase
MNFSVWPPEVNSVLLLDGPGSTPMLEAAAAWDGIGSELSSAASTFGSVTSDLAGDAWQGPSATSMSAAASRYVNWLSGAATQAQQSAVQARAAASAVESALSTIVNPNAISANRGQFVRLVISNLFGQNAPAIAAAESEYEEMWAHDVAVMSGYHSSASASVAQLGQWEQTLEELSGLFQHAKPLATGLPAPLQTLANEIFGSKAGVLPGTGLLNFSGTSSLVTKFEVNALAGLKQVLGLSGLYNVVSDPSNPLLQLFTGDVPIPGLKFFLSNTPPKILPLLLGETVQQTVYTTPTGQHIPVVQITPAHPSGEYVVAIHGGAFIFSPSLFHWLNYTMMAHQTGATIEVPIYPLLQQGGTAPTVVPGMASFIANEVALHGQSNVSVIGDSAGGNLALAATELIAQFNPALEPSSMVLLSPWLDLTMTNPNIGYVHDPLLPLGPAKVIGQEWAGGLNVKDPLVSPLYGSLQNLPPTYVYSGSLDELSPDVLVLQQNAIQQGVAQNFNYILANGEIHDWIILTVDGPRYWSQIDHELGL